MEDLIEYKTCTKCGEILPKTEEYFHRNLKRNTLDSQCRMCAQILSMISARKRSKEISIYQKLWYSKNKERLSKVRKEYRSSNLEKERERSRNYYKNNKETVDQKNKKWARENKEKQKRISNRHLYKVEEEYLMCLLDKQRGCCAICGESLIKYPFKETYIIDHCHETDIIRGLLCRKCNMGIGLLRDSSELCINAYYYLSKYDSVD